MKPLTPQQSEIYAVLQTEGASLTIEEISERAPEINPGSLQTQLSRLVRAGYLSRTDTGGYSVVVNLNKDQDEQKPENEGEVATSQPRSQSESALPNGLASTDVFRGVEDALPLDSFRAALRLMCAFAYVRQKRIDAEVPTLAIAGAAGTGKTVTFNAAAMMLNGTQDDVVDARTFTSQQQIIGRRQYDKDAEAYTVTPSVMLYPPSRPAPALVVVDELGEAKKAVLEGVGLLLRLEDHYVLEGTKVELRCALGFTWNRPTGVTDPNWHPFEGWEGATRRMLLMDVGPRYKELQNGLAKKAARRIFGEVLYGQDLPLVRLDSYYPAPAPTADDFEEVADDLIDAVFVNKAAMPVGDPVLRGAAIGYATLYKHEPRAALVAAITDFAIVAATIPGRVKPSAQRAINKARESVGLGSVSIEVAKESDVLKLERDEMKPRLTEAQKRSLASHLAKFAKSTPQDAYAELYEYGLIYRRTYYLLRGPRYLLELVVRVSFAALAGVSILSWNILALILNFPQIPHYVMQGVGAWAFSPGTRLAEWRCGETHEVIKKPKRYILELFGAELDARPFVRLEDEARVEDKEAA